MPSKSTRKKLAPAKKAGAPSHPKIAPLALAHPRKATTSPGAKPGKRVWMVSRYAKQRSSVAEALAAQSGLEVKRIDLSMLKSNYIGETEKNLARIFAEAESKNWLLFFDEADALFGKRTDVKDAHDRYANQEVGYFLDQLQHSTSSVIVASRRKQNIDPAFLRRLRISMMNPLSLPPVRRKKIRKHQ